MALSSALISSLTVEKLVRTTGDCKMEFLAVFSPHRSADGEPSNSASERLEQFTVVLATSRRCGGRLRRLVWRCACSRQRQKLAGGFWKGDVLIADLEELETMDASEFYSKKTQCERGDIS